MTASEAGTSIIGIVTGVLKDKGCPVTQIGHDTVLLGGSLGIDSLDLAVVVIRMGELVAKDPFEKGFIDFHTIGEMAELYSD